jgi:hypothetical protein
MSGPLHRTADLAADHAVAWHADATIAPVHGLPPTVHRPGRRLPAGVRGAA